MEREAKQQHRDVLEYTRHTLATLEGLEQTTLRAEAWIISPRSSYYPANTLPNWYSKGKQTSLYSPYTYIHIISIKKVEIVNSKPRLILRYLYRHSKVNSDDC